MTAGYRPALRMVAESSNFTEDAGWRVDYAATVVTLAPVEDGGGDVIAQSWTGRRYRFRVTSVRVDIRPGEGRAAIIAVGPAVLTDGSDGVQQRRHRWWTDAWNIGGYVEMPTGMRTAVSAVLDGYGIALPT